MIRSTTLTLLAWTSLHDDIPDRHDRRRLDGLASHVFHGDGKPGQAQMMKLLNNMLSFAAIVASCEAFALRAKAGLDPDALAEAINTSTGRNPATTHKLPNNILPRSFGYGAKMHISFKDISLFLEEPERPGDQAGDRLRDLAERRKRRRLHTGQALREMVPHRDHRRGCKFNVMDVPLTAEQAARYTASS